MWKVTCPSLTLYLWILDWLRLTGLSKGYWCIHLFSAVLECWSQRISASLGLRFLRSFGISSRSWFGGLLWKARWLLQQLVGRLRFRIRLRIRWWVLMRLETARNLLFEVLQLVLQVLLVTLVLFHSSVLGRFDFEPFLLHRFKRFHLMRLFGNLLLYQQRFLWFVSGVCLGYFLVCL